MQPRALLKPTLDTLYHIDYTWWERSDEDLRTYLLSHLTADQRERLNSAQTDSLIDFVDPDTGEVTRLDGLQVALQTAAREPDFITPHTSLVDGIFRVLIANNNRPISSNDLSVQLSRPAATILKMLTGNRVYKGIRPTTS